MKADFRRTSREEADLAGQLAASTTDVVRVVKVFEYTP
jgi:hypothetical protein